MVEKRDIQLTDQHKLFCEFYVKHGNRTQAVLDAGYKQTRRAASVTGVRLVRDPLIIDYLGELRREAARSAGITAGEYLKELLGILKANVSEIYNPETNELYPIHEWPEQFQIMVSSIETKEIFEGVGKDREQIGVQTKVKFPEKTKILEMIGRHIDVSAFQDQKEQDALAKTFADILAGRLGYVADNTVLGSAQDNAKPH